MAESFTSSFCFLFGAILAVHLAEAAIPAVFIFGDSTFDVGTNNFLNESQAKANFPYNGIDYPYSIPTGRFSNGYNTADQIVRLLGCKRSPPPFLYLAQHYDSFKRNLLHGANFASGGSGILDATGSLRFGKVVPLGEQIRQFSTARAHISEILNPNATYRFLEQSLFLISVGSNDIFEYQFASRTGGNVSAPQFLTALLSQYQNHLQNLYELGARKFGIASVPPIGCCPYERALFNSDVCIKEVNDLAAAFFTNLEALLQTWTANVQDVKYSLGNTYLMTMDTIENPLVFGLKEVKSACCGNGSYNGEVPCIIKAEPKLCPDRDGYLFWDLFHPTEAASRLAALSLVAGSSRYVTPVNISRVVGTNI